MPDRVKLLSTAREANIENLKFELAGRRSVGLVKGRVDLGSLVCQSNCCFQDIGHPSQSNLAQLSGRERQQEPDDKGTGKGRHQKRGSTRGRNWMKHTNTH